jgi:endonuclease YncB( thermonuclease family)
MIRVVLLLLALTDPLPALAQEIVTGRASVVDGDNLEIRGRNTRLAGIDAPKSRHWCRRNKIAYRCGQDAAFALADKIGVKLVSCVRRDAGNAMDAWSRSAR